MPLVNVHVRELYIIKLIVQVLRDTAAVYLYLNT